MPTITTRHHLAGDDDSILRCRTDLLNEVETSPGVFEQDFGPFGHYRRTLTTVEAPSRGTPDEATDSERPTGRVVDETIVFKLAIILWPFLFNPMMKRALADADRRPRGRWWWPQAVIGEQTTRLVSLLSILSIMAGYLGVVISQTIAFVARDFDVGDDVQSNTLAAIRVGVIVSVVLIRKADLIGRRPLLLGFTFGAIAFTIAGALATNMVVLGATQAIARGFDTGLLTLLSLAVLEEVPAGVRSLGVGLMGMASGLGAGFVIMVLPVADTSPGGWRWVYALSAVFLPVLWWVARNLPETRRFVAADQQHAPGDIDRRIFLLLAFAAFAGAMFFSPASQLKNQYLLDERGFSAAKISLYQLVIGTPVGLSIVPAGYLADRFGRKPIGGWALLLGTLTTAALYFSDGAALWLLSLAGIWALGASYPALRSFQTELFPTRARARVGGWLDIVSVSGSAVGLVIAGQLAERWGSLGPAITVLIGGPDLGGAAGVVRLPRNGERRTRGTQSQRSVAGEVSRLSSARSQRLPGLGWACPPPPTAPRVRAQRASERSSR